MLHRVGLDSGRFLMLLPEAGAADIHSMQVWRIVLESDDGGTFEDWQIKAKI